MIQHDRKDRGSALVMAVFVLALLTAMGAALLFYSENEKKMGEASIKPKQAFYYAEAGLEHARRALWLVNRAEDFDDDLQAATGGTFADPIGFDPSTIAPIYDSQDNVIGFSGYGNDTPLVSLRKFENGWYGAFMSNDHGETRTNSVDTDNRVILAGVGVGPDRSFEVVEAVIDLDPFLPEMPPAAIFMLGPTPAFGSATSKAKSYIGNDCGTAGGDYYPVVGTIGPAAEANAESGAHPNPNWATGPYSSPGDAISDMSASPVPGMSDTTYSINTEWTSCEGMKDMIEGMRRVADYNCADGTRLASPSCPADVSNPQHIYFGEGDLEVMWPVPHAGVLVVTGELVLGGDIDFKGLILVVGEGRLRFNGAGTGINAGSLIIADIAGPDGVYGNSDDCTGPNDGFGVGVYDERGGGNAGTVYCSTVLDIVEQAHPYAIEQFRQH
ncbi:MAG: hypothetical protein GTN89_03035 [Acidobacteria bacterium]|nr:hypothetical protein [Acidobacteriota bacterium]NIM62568.1 hypothetical protein [Acidobacteriota bacterium]NIO58301.1 hypothetical protein [Acidobacteriota bacterium]NIQ29357.1 hypothetical protein [Acidobacteriota bacterium]NIQ83957.1 hypothetical protein [Acidobacteriota bacterium]